MAWKFFSKSMRIKICKLMEWEMEDMAQYVVKIEVEDPAAKRKLDQSDDDETDGTSKSFKPSKSPKK